MNGIEQMNVNEGKERYQGKQSELKDRTNMMKWEIKDLQSHKNERRKIMVCFFCYAWLHMTVDRYLARWHFRKNNGYVQSSIIKDKQ